MTQKLDVDSLPFVLVPDDIVQLNPETTRNKAFAGCFMTVTEPKSWGAQGYVQGLGENRETIGGQAYYRAKWEEMSPPLGSAYWTIDPPSDIGDS